MTRRSLVKVMPALTREYGLLPWHFGGPDELSAGEQRAYITDYDDLVRRRQREAQSRGRTTRRR